MVPALQKLLVELTSIIEASNFILISCVIDKEQLRRKPGVPPNPYHLALGFCLETLYELLQEKNQDDKLTHVMGNTAPQHAQASSTMRTVQFRPFEGFNGECLCSVM